MSSVNHGFFWLSDNGRPDNVLFRIEHLVNVTQLSFDSWEMVPFLAISKYSDLVLQELIVSAKINFSWFKSVVLGAGDKTTRQLFEVTPKEVIRRLERFFNRTKYSLAKIYPFFSEDLVEMGKNLVDFTLSLAEIVDIYIAAQGRKMLSLGMQYAKKTIYNGNPLDKWDDLETLLQTYEQKNIGCYIMAYLEDCIALENDAFNRSLKTFFQIIKTILYEHSLLNFNNELKTVIEENNSIPKSLVNRVGFQGTVKELENFIESLKSRGVDYIILGGPIVWQQKGLTDILTSF